MGSGVNVKGSAIANTMKYLEEKYGKEAVGKIAAALPGQTRDTIMHSLPSSWYPVEIVGDLCEVIQKDLGGSDPDFLFKVSREAAKATFNVFYKVFFKFGSPQFIIGKVASVWSTLATAGRLEIAEKGEKFVVLRLQDFPYKNSRYCSQRLTGWFHAPLELSGCEITESTHTACTSTGSPYCEWRIVWK
jgi:hypothetical protein